MQISIVAVLLYVVNELITNYMQRRYFSNFKLLIGFKFTFFSLTLL